MKCEIKNSGVKRNCASPSWKAGRSGVILEVLCNLELVVPSGSEMNWKLIGSLGMMMSVWAECEAKFGNLVKQYLLTNLV